METERAKRLADFVSWVGANIRGDEKGEAQVYLDRLFQAFGHAGVKEAGATLEDRIKKTDGKGTAFADLVWKPVVLIEMKKRGEDLTRHYRQAFDYWTRLVPVRPRYVILCNFDEFWVYDFDTQMDAPVDRVKIQDLSSRWGPLGFLFPKPFQPVFGNDHLAFTRKAADQLADCFNKMMDKHRPGGPIDRPHAQRFVLQMLVPEKTAEMLHADLERCGIEPVDTQGRVVDTHSLRHGYATALARSGVPLKLTQTLLRHSDPKLTMNVYAHLTAFDLHDAIADALPDLTRKESSPEPLAMTGTDPVVTPISESPAHHLPTRGDVSGQSLSATGAMTSSESQALMEGETREKRGVDASGPVLSSSVGSAPRRTRTYNPLIKSQLLCQLS